MKSQRDASTLVSQARRGEDPSGGKVDNHPAALTAKTDIRRHVLDDVKPARVLDLFCGTGTMYRAVWRGAADYVGCDARPWRPTDPPRYVADNRRLLRSIDLGKFNVFDLDAYGSPWEQMEILLHRRAWAPGERGAVIVTDGSAQKLRLGGMPHAMQRILGRGISVPSSSAATDLQNIAIRSWLAKARVRPLRSWQARGLYNQGGQSGGAAALYTAVVFVGLG